MVNVNQEGRKAAVPTHSPGETTENHEQWIEDSPI
jgi:hypothetical protein